MGRIQMSRGFKLALLMLVTLLGAGSMLFLRLADFRGQRVPALDGQQISCWLDADQVVLPTSDDTRPAPMLNLRTGAVTSLPDLPPLPGQPGVDLRRSDPFVSPDGRWMLFTETRIDRRRAGAPLGTGRFRLLSRSGAPAPWSVSPQGFTRRDCTSLAWLPDSSGWVTHTLQADGAIRFHRFHLDAPGSPEEIHTAWSSPGAFQRQTGGLPILRRVHTDGMLILADAYAPSRVTLLAPNPAVGARTGQLYLPQDDRSVMEYQWTDPLSARGDWLLAIASATEARPLAALREWFQGPRPRTTFYRLPLDGGPPKPLHTVDATVSRFSLGPDDRTLVYWIGARAFRLDLR